MEKTNKQKKAESVLVSSCLKNVNFEKPIDIYVFFKLNNISHGYPNFATDCFIHWFALILLTVINSLNVDSFSVNSKLILILSSTQKVNDFNLSI